MFFMECFLKSEILLEQFLLVITCSENRTTALTLIPSLTLSLADTEVWIFNHGSSCRIRIHKQPFGIKLSTVAAQQSHRQPV